MPDSYTRISKPTGAAYTPVNGPGKYIYDDPLVLYDAGNVAYDGGDGSDYVKILKPTGSSYINIPKPTS